MTAKRILLAGLLSGIAMFMWTSIAHMATPLGLVGIREIPNEQAVLSTMQTTLGQDQGLFLFPGMGVPPDAPRAQRSEAMKNYQQILDKNPSGILIYKPAGQKAITPGQLGREFGLELAEAFLLALLLSMTTLRTFGSRMGFVIVVGIIAAITTNMSYWNWFGFPTNYTMAAMFVEAMKYVAAGVVVALVLGRGAVKTSSASA
jgi:hypothetical protein